MQEASKLSRAEKKILFKHRVPSIDKLTPDHVALMARLYRQLYQYYLKQAVRDEIRDRELKALKPMPEAYYMVVPDAMGFAREYACKAWQYESLAKGL